MIYLNFKLFAHSVQVQNYSKSILLFYGLGDTV